MHNQEQQKPSMKTHILEVIEKKGITPKPKWHFLLKEWAVWGSAVFALLFGSIATALTIYLINANRFTIDAIRITGLEYLFRWIPILWIVLTLLGIFYTVHAAKETRRGYKWNVSWLVGVAILCSVCIGSTAYTMGVGEKIDTYLLEQVPLYKPLTNFKPRHWMNIEEGVVAGVVLELSESGVTILPLDGEMVHATFIPETVFHLQQEIELGMPVHIVGTTTTMNGEEVFTVSEISTFKGRGGKMRKPFLHKPKEFGEQAQRPLF
jgi:hypothetical protein